MKQLETLKAAYNSLKRQYVDQCAGAEKYREELRNREESLRKLREAAGLTQIEVRTRSASRTFALPLTMFYR